MILQTLSNWWKWLKNWATNAIPDHDTLADLALLRPIAHHLADKQLWRPRNAAVARGVAIGLFWSFIVPVGQIPVAVAHCIYKRGNIPAAILATFLTNPLNTAFWWWLAFRIGSVLMGHDGAFIPPPHGDFEWGPWLHWALEYGKPIILGLWVLAIGFAVVGYFAVKLVWRIQTAFKRHKRLKQADLRKI